MDRATFAAALQMHRARAIACLVDGNSQRATCRCDRERRSQITMSKSEITKYLAEIGRKGGKVNSAAQNAARRENGKKGGRPKKQPRLDTFLARWLRTKGI